MKTSSHWRHMYNEGKQWTISSSYVKNINIFGYLGAWGGGGGASIIRLGPSWFTSIPLFYINLHVKYRSNMIKAISWYEWNLLIFKIKKIKKYFLIFFGVMLGPYIKSRVTRAIEMSWNAALITMETNVQQGEAIWNPVFHIWAKMYKNVYFGLFRGPWGGLQWSDWAYLAFQLSSHPYPCTCQIRKQSHKKFFQV